MNTDRIEGAAARIGNQAKDALDNAFGRGKVDRLGEQAGSLVRQQPLLALLSVAGIGFALSRLLLSRR